MSSVEEIRERPVTPDELRAAFDDLLFRWGQETPNGTVSTEFLFPGTYETNGGVDIEKHPFVTLGRYDTENGRRYTYGVAIPHNGVSTDTMIFEGSRILFEGGAYIQTGTDNWEDEKENGEYSPEEVKEMYTLVTDPGIMNRSREIYRFYHSRHLRRSRVGRLIARVRRMDEPKYL